MILTRFILGWGAAGLLAACASIPAPSQALQAAQLAIDSAEQARAGEFAALELGEARDRLAQARNSVAEENMEAARLLADEARVNAELALARARAGQALEVNRQLQESNRVLQEELDRDLGSPQ